MSREEIEAGVKLASQIITRTARLHTSQEKAAGLDDLARVVLALDAQRNDRAPHAAREPPASAIPMILTCPCCGARHIDEGEFTLKLHHTHACQHCGMVWRPALVPTVGVQFLPGFKNKVESGMLDAAGVWVADPPRPQ